eukprot:gene14058-15522_t
MPPMGYNLLDPSQVYRPESKYQDLNSAKRTQKGQNDFRQFYQENLQTENVMRTYQMMHSQQTLNFVKEKIAKWGSLDKAEMTIFEAVFMLDDLIDESDPDIDLPNSVHAFQTAERIRAKHPDKDWFHLVGLVHDLGKVLALWSEPQFAVVGDTFPVGCKFQDSIVFPDTFQDNPDSQDPLLSTKYGIYEPNCGLKNIIMSWGHDEYMYQVLVKNECKVPEEGLNIIRFHSFYPWHSCGDYSYLCSEKDNETLRWVQEFNKFDLYSKSDSIPDIQAVMPYYQSLIDKYCPGKLKW